MVRSVRYSKANRQNEVRMADELQYITAMAVREKSAQYSELFGLVIDDVLYDGILLVEKHPRRRAVLEASPAEIAYVCIVEKRGLFEST